MEVFKKKNYLGVAGSIVLFLSTFFPFIKWKKEYESYLGSVKFSAFIKSWGGWVLFLMALASAMIIFRKVLEEKIPQVYNTNFGNRVKGWGEKGLFAPIGISSLILILVVVNNSLFYKVKFLGQTYSIKDETTVGIGFWFAIVGIVLLIAHSVLYKGEEGSAVAATPVQPGQPAQQPMNPSVDTFTQPAQQPTYTQPEQPMQQQPMQQQPVQPQDFNNNNQF